MPPTDEAKARQERAAAEQRAGYGRALNDELEGLQRRADAGDEAAKRRVPEVKAELKRIGEKVRDRKTPAEAEQFVAAPLPTDTPPASAHAPTDPKVSPAAAAAADPGNLQLTGEGYDANKAPTSENTPGKTEVAQQAADAKADADEPKTARGRASKSTAKKSASSPAKK